MMPRASNEELAARLQGASRVRQPVKLLRTLRFVRPEQRLASSVAPVDARTKIGRTLRAFRTDLITHVGGDPTVVQQAIIEMACQLKARLEVMDNQFADSGEIPSVLDCRNYLAWVGALGKTVSRLGGRIVLPRKTLRDLLAEHDAPRSAQDGNGSPARVNGAGTGRDAAERAPRGAEQGDSRGIAHRDPGRPRNTMRAPT